MELEESGNVHKEFPKSIFHHFRLIIPNGKLRVLLVRRAMQTNFKRQTTILIKECVHQPSRLYPQQVEPHPLKRGNLTTRANSSSPCNQWPTATNTGHTFVSCIVARHTYALFGIWNSSHGTMLVQRVSILVPANLVHRRRIAVAFTYRDP